MKYLAYKRKVKVLEADPNNGGGLMVALNDEVVELTSPNEKRRLQGESDTDFFERMSVYASRYELTEPYTFPDGSVAYSLDKATADALSLSYTALPYFVVDSADLPTAHQDLRNAWVISNQGVISVHLNRAKKEWKHKLRKQRKTELMHLDRDYLKAQESENTALMESIAERKQYLRDITSDPRFDTATTVEEVKAIVIEPAE